MLNNCILTGNLGADPEVFYSSDGDPVATFNLAFKSSKKKTGWIKITCFRRLAEITERCLHKGARIAVIGTLDQQKWETDEGVMRSSFQLIANTLEFLKKRMAEDLKKDRTAEMFHFKRRAMAKHYVELIIRIIIEIADWLKTRNNNGRKNNESKTNPEA